MTVQYTGHMIQTETRDNNYTALRGTVNQAIK